MINLIHHSFSTYYSQERWCAGNSNLTAANIKKDITIFGVKGTYEDTTKKLIINNGALTGIVTSSEYTVGTVSVDKTKTWGGKSYMLLWYLNQTTGVNAAPRYQLRISDITSIGSITGNITGTLKGTFNFGIGADVIMSCKMNAAVNVALGLRYMAGANGTYKVHLTMRTPTQACTPYDGTITQYTLMNNGTAVMNTELTKSTNLTGAGTSAFYIYTDVSSSNTNLVITCWANRLWIDTSVAYSNE